MEFGNLREKDLTEANGLTDISAALHSDLKVGLSGPLGGAARIAATTLDGIVHTPEGLWDAAKYEVNHPLEALKTVAGSAALAAALKVVLPEAGPVGKIAGLAMGAWFVAGAAPRFLNAYKDGLKADTWSDLHAAGKQWGDAAGQLGVNSALGMAGYKLGAGITGNILARESFDNFADWKQNVWNDATDNFKNSFGFDTTIPTASSVGMRPNYSLDGDSAKLLDSSHSAPAGKEIGPTDGNTPMSATVMLTGKASLLKMDRYIARMAQGDAPALTDQNNAFEEQFGAKPEALEAVKAFAAKNTLAVEEADLRSGRVFLTGKTSDFQKAFNVVIKDYESPDGTVKGTQVAVSVPRDLVPHVRAVLGVDEQRVAKSNYQLQTRQVANVSLPSSGSDSSAAASGAPGAVSISASDAARLQLQPAPNLAQVGTAPADLPHDDFFKEGGYKATEIARAQNMPLGTGGEGQHGAFISLSGGIDLPDYNKFYPARGLEQPKPLGIIEIDGAKNSPGNPANGDTENVLDATQMQSMAPKANIDMILGPNTDQGLVDVFERGIFPKNGEAQKAVLSASWGLAEQKQTPQTLNTLSIEFRQAAIRGVQIFAGAGDSGAKANSLTFQPEYPASDPNVVGVGGLKMVLNPDGTLKSASAWDEGENSSTGGGVSKIFRLPWWQKNANVPNNPDTGLLGRGVPDISTNAAKSTGFPLRVDGKDVVIGGTSAGAPLYAGMMLNINAELAAQGIKPITPLNAWMYARANDSDIFHDVTTGGNHGFTSGKGWDAVTGLGWVDGQKMLDAMKLNQTVNMSKFSWLAPIFPNGINFDGDPQQQAPLKK
jgi:kumamolisin